MLDDGKTAQLMRFDKFSRNKGENKQDMKSWVHGADAEG